MSNATPVRIGQINGSGDELAKFLNVFGGEVLTAFDTRCVTLERHLVRDIQHGKTASFPVTWKLTASYHTPGEELVGQSSDSNERILEIDGLLLSDVFIPNLDEAMNHFDYRGIYANQAGEALANSWDRSILQSMVLAARASATVTDGYGGSKLVNANYKTTSADLRSGFFNAMQTLAEKDVPLTQVAGYLKPAQYYLLAADTTVLNKDWDGKGSYADGEVIRIAGAEVVMTNNLPTTNITTGKTTYQGDFTNTAGVIAHRSAVGTVRLLGLGIEEKYDIRRQGYLIVAKYAVGHGILRPESSVELATA